MMLPSSHGSEGKGQGETTQDINRSEVKQEQGGVTAEPVLQNKVPALHDQIDRVKCKMTENVGKILDQVEKLDNLVMKSKKMEEGAQHFKKTSQKVSRSYWWNNVKLIMVIVVIVVFIVLIIILLATGVIPTSAPVPRIGNPTSKP